MRSLPARASIGTKVVSNRSRATLLVAMGVDAFFIATSILHALSERGVDVGFRFTGLHVEDEFGAPALWQSVKAGVVAVVVGFVCLRTRRWVLVPWVTALGVISVSWATRFQDYFVGNATVGTALVGAAILGLVLAGAVSVPDSSNARGPVVAFVAFLFLGGALDLLTDRLVDTFLQPIFSIVEGGVELLLLTLVCAAVVRYAAPTDS